MSTKVPEHFYKYRPMATATDIERVGAISKIFVKTCRIASRR